MVIGYNVTKERYMEENWDEVDQRNQNEERENCPKHRVLIIWRSKYGEMETGVM